MAEELKFPDQKTFTREELSQEWKCPRSKIDAYIRTGQLKEALPPAAMRDLYRWTFYRCHNNEKFDADETNVGLLDIIEDGELFGKYAGKIGQGKITSCPEHLYLPIDDNAMVERTDKDYNLVRYFYDLDGNALIMIEDAEDEYEICFAPIKKEHLNSLIIPLKEVKRFERENNIGQKSKKTFSAVIGAKEKRAEQKQQNSEIVSTTTTDNVLNKRPAPPKRLIDIKEVCKRTGFARPTIYKKVREGVFPPFEKRGINTRWRESVIDDYVEGTWHPTDDEVKGKEVDE